MCSWWKILLDESTVVLLVVVDFVELVSSVFQELRESRQRGRERVGDSSLAREKRLCKSSISGYGVERFSKGGDGTGRSG